MALRADAGIRSLYRTLKVHDDHLAVVLATGASDVAVVDSDVVDGVVARIELPVRNPGTIRAPQLVDAYRD